MEIMLGQLPLSLSLSLSLSLGMGSVLLASSASHSFFVRGVGMVSWVRRWAVVVGCY